MFFSCLVSQPTWSVTSCSFVSCCALPFFFLCVAIFKAALIIIFILTMGQMTACPHRELSPNSAVPFRFLEPYSVFQLMVLGFWFESTLFPAAASNPQYTNWPAPNDRQLPLATCWRRRLNLIIIHQSCVYSLFCCPKVVKKY